MTERKRTKRQERSYAEMLAHIAELEDWNRRDRLKRAAIPRDWYEIAAKTPTKPRKVRLTAGYDADVARWYRSLGQGYQARMNRVLRTYMLLVISKEIRGLGSVDTYRIQSTIAAMVTTARKFRAVFSYRVATLRNCLSLEKQHSIRDRIA